MNITAKVSRSATSTSSVGTMFGAISRKVIHQSESPRARAASTNSRGLIAWVADLITRVMLGVYTAATAMTITDPPVPNPAMMTSTSRNGGSASTMSTVRVTIVSVQPPR